jgi:hypothetical protein
MLGSMCGKRHSKGLFFNLEFPAAYACGKPKLSRRDTPQPAAVKVHWNRKIVSFRWRAWMSASPSGDLQAKNKRLKNASSNS